MSYLVVDKNGKHRIFSRIPIRITDFWFRPDEDGVEIQPSNLPTWLQDRTWEDDPTSI